MEESNKNKILSAIKQKNSYRGQLISTSFHKPQKNEKRYLDDLINDKRVNKIYKSILKRRFHDDIYQSQISIINRMLSKLNTYIVSPLDPYIKAAIDISAILLAYYQGTKSIYVSKNPKADIDRIKSYSDLIEVQQLFLSSDINSVNTDIMIIHPSDLFALLEFNTNFEYPLALNYDNYIIEKIQMYDSRELNHVSVIIKKIKDCKKKYGFDINKFQMILTSTPIINRKEVALQFWDTVKNASILFADDSRNEDYDFYFWKPSLETDSKIEAVDKINITRANIDTELKALLKSIKLSAIDSKILIWINDIGLSDDFNLQLLKSLKTESFYADITIKSVGHLEDLDYEDFYSFDTVIVINPSKIAGYLLHQCSKLVNGKESFIFCFLGDDHLSNQLLRSKDYSLNWAKEEFNLPTFFILKSSEIEKFYEKEFNKNLLKFNDIYKVLEKNE